MATLERGDHERVGPVGRGPLHSGKVVRAEADAAEVDEPRAIVVDGGEHGHVGRPVVRGEPEDGVQPMVGLGSAGNRPGGGRDPGRGIGRRKSVAGHGASGGLPAPVVATSVTASVAAWMIPAVARLGNGLDRQMSAPPGPGWTLYSGT